jgi:hypothetical protein
MPVVLENGAFRAVPGLPLVCKTDSAATVWLCMFSISCQRSTSGINARERLLRGCRGRGKTGSMVRLILNGLPFEPSWLPVRTVLFILF